MQGIVFDLILVGVLLLFALLGARKGLVLSLCSLVAVVVALVGGSLLSQALTPTVTGYLAPPVLAFLEEQLASGALLLSQQEGFLGSLILQLTQSGTWTVDMPGFAAALAQSVAQAVAAPVLFLLGFLVVLLAWTLLSHALDLISRLPVLHQLNTAGGFLFGAVKGALLLAVIALVLLRFFPAYFPQQAVDSSYLLPLLQSLPPLF